MDQKKVAEHTPKIRKMVSGPIFIKVVIWKRQVFIKMTLWKVNGKDGIFQDKNFMIDHILKVKKKANGYGGIVMVKKNMRAHISMIKKMVCGYSGMSLENLKLMGHIITILNGQVFLRMVGIIRVKWLV